MNFLYALIIQPIELIFEIIFNVMYHLLNNEGFSVLSVSIAMSLLTLPLYYSADKMQQNEIEKRKSLSKWQDHIKKTFKGDERFMLLQEYYRQNNYSPINALSGSFSLLLEIPFFIAGYHFLSHLEVLNGASFYSIQSLGAPDGLLHIGNIQLNLLPILMTAINCISGAIYTKGSALKDKIQLYAMALIFLVLLYNSPSGLVIYWTMNNIFSLVKNIFYKLKHPALIASLLCAIGGILLFRLFVIHGIAGTRKRLYVVSFICSLTLIPLITLIGTKLFRIMARNRVQHDGQQTFSNNLTFFLSTLCMSLFAGLLIPLSVISASPAEFVDIHAFKNPLYLAFHTLFIASGYFTLWIGVFYIIASKKGKGVISRIVWILIGISLTNYMFFNKDLGTLSPYLVYDLYPHHNIRLIAINLFVDILIIFILSFIYSIKKIKKILPFIYAIIIIAISGVSFSHIVKTNKVVKTLNYVKDGILANSNEGTITPIIPFSKTQKNVIVFMLDRAINGYIPYLFEEKPILKEQFAGFTYYPNTLSHGGTTNYGAPGLFGGYEYIPTEMNKRSAEKLVTKHNEALEVMPVLFLQNGYNVTVCDAPYANYQWIPDLSIYNKWGDIKTYITMGAYSASLTGRTIDDNRRNFIFYSFFRISPLLLHPIFYDSGNYYSNKRPENEMFAKSYSVLMNLAKLSYITEDEKPNFFMIDNDITHEPAECQLPDYEYSNEPHNEGFHTAAEGHIKMEGHYDIIHYHSNMAAMLLLGKWFDWMRENNVYDNTRIIIVADHGRELGQFDYMKMKNINVDVQGYNPLLMVKDFNAADFTTDDTFMTNADVPTIAIENLIRDAKNPFTNKSLNNLDKTSKGQIVTTASKWDVLENNGNIFDTSDGRWYSVHDNIFKEENWERIE